MFTRVLPRPLAVLALLVASAACGPRGPRAQAPTGTFDVAQVLAPQALAEALVAQGGGRVEAQTSFRLTPIGTGTRGPQAVTTGTRLDVDAQGHYELDEENDADGGRLVVFTGPEIAVKLRYGKLIKRDVRPPEPSRVRDQALGGPMALWEVLGSHAQVEVSESTRARHPAGFDTLTARVTFSPTATGRQGAPVAASPLSAWRQTARPLALEGRLVFAPGHNGRGPFLLEAKLEGRFSAAPSGGPQLQGELRVQLKVEKLGQVPPIVMPEEAEPLRIGQRTVLEERALLPDRP